jgi:site-specific recombinase XerD
MSENVARSAAPASWRSESFSLYASNGRKYLNHAERQRALVVMRSLADDEALFALTLAWTGARISEVLALTPNSFQIEDGLISIRTLKRRQFSVREIPIPPKLMAAIVGHFELAATQRDPRIADHRLWPWSRTTAWRIVKRVMATAGIVGRHACPRGLRHAFGVGSLRAGVPLNLVQRFLGHARISTTAIYASACGPEEVAFAAQFWRFSNAKVSASKRHLTIRI